MCVNHLVAVGGLDSSLNRIHRLEQGMMEKNTITMKDRWYNYIYIYSLPEPLVTLVTKGTNP